MRGILANQKRQKILVHTEMKIFITLMVNDILHLWLVSMSAVGMCREQILHLWSINTLTGETTPSFLFYFISMSAKFSLKLTRC